MSKIGYIWIMCMLLACVEVAAQTYERVSERNIWNSSENVTGVRQDSLSRSEARISAGYIGGGFRDAWEASEGWSAGASTASIRHLERMSLKGSFSFLQTEGYDMCGSMFIDPGFYPVDILEFTPGRKTLQTYSFEGGLSYDVSARWRIGAKIDFLSSNMAKRKDLRYVNWKLDMTVSPGFMYHCGNFAIGASYLFAKNSESVKADQLGTSDSSYYAFLDKGLMYGHYGVWTGGGLHLDENGVNGFPVKEFRNGLALQVQYKGLFAEAGYSVRNGIIGEKEYIWFRYPGQEAFLLAGFQSGGHDVRLDLGWNTLELTETVLEKVSSNGITTVREHGNNRILRQDTWNICPSYEYVSCRWEAGADLSLYGRESIASQIYPYVGVQSLAMWSADVHGMVRVWRFEVGASVGYAGGSLRDEGKLVQEGTGIQSGPYRLQQWYDLETEYAVADRAKASLSLKYNIWRGIFVRAQGTYEHGFGLRYIKGSDRVGAVLELGYDF